MAWAFLQPQINLSVKLNRQGKPKPVPPKPPPEPVDNGHWMALHPYVIDRELVMSLTHSKTSENTTYSVPGPDAEVDGPDGTYRLTRGDGPWAGYFNGTYRASYPYNFSAPRLKPGHYRIRWYAMPKAHWLKSDDEIDGPRSTVLVAETMVNVTSTWWVDKC